MQIKKNIYIIGYFIIIVFIFFFLDRNLELTLYTKLGYRNVGDKDGDWKLFATSVEKRNLDCVSEEVNNSCLYISC